MYSAALNSRIAETPAFVLDEEQLLANLQVLQNIRAAAGCRILYSMKALPLTAVLELLKSGLDGISVSSLFEARLAREVVGEAASLHLTTPGLRDAEFAELSGLCSHISFNSLSQHQRLQAQGGAFAPGLRINPQLSFAADQRYDPCRPHSKLGVAMADIGAALPVSITGLHVHTVFGCRDEQPLLATIARIRPLLAAHPQLQWLNLGGGYLYHSIADLSRLIDEIRRLREEFGLQVYLEPGKALVGNAGYLVASVLDKFTSEGKTLLVLDTSVNHHPEVFEYQRKPLLLDEAAVGETAVLVGSSCLAGDVFGEYAFAVLPAVGDRLAFADCGAYTLIKASRFNGYNLPTIYWLSQESLQLCKQYDYQDYRQQWRA